jgi:hypothetical protein
MNVKPQTTRGRAAGSSAPSLSASLTVILIMLIAACLAVFSMQTPKAAPENAPLTEFSSERAMEKVKLFAQEVHGYGTPGRAKMRELLLDELRALGFTPEVQTGTAVRQGGFLPYDRAGEAENILVRLTGTAGQSKPAILFVTHYNGTLNSRGASDAMGVAAFLETMRALKQGEPLKNDLIFLFTDMRHPFPLGSKLFAEHRWSADTVLVFSFEAWGTSGPVFLFDTTKDNGWLLDQYAQAAPSPRANSLITALANLMPNAETDMRLITEEIGAQGMSFSFIGGAERFHNEADTPEHISEATLQQEGALALSLAKHFGSLDLKEAEKAPDMVYMNLFGLLIRYPTDWVLPILLFTLALFLYSVWHGIRSRQVRVLGMLGGFLAFLLALIASTAAVAVLGMVILPMLKNPVTQVTNAPLFLASYLAITFAVLLAVFGIFKNRMQKSSLYLGALLFWLLLAGITSFLMPEASFFFTLPLCCALASLLYLSRTNDTPSPRRALILSLLSLPTVLLFTQLMYALYLYASLQFGFVFALLFGMLTGVLLPLLDLLIMHSRRVSLAGTAVGTALFAASFLLPAYSAESPKASVMLYGYDADTGQAAFGTLDPSDPWIDQYITDDSDVTFDPFLPETILETIPNPVRTGAAKPAPLPVPDVQVIRDVTNGDARELHLKVIPSRELFNTVLTFKSDAEIHTVELNGRRLQNKQANSKRWELLYYEPPVAGFDVKLMLKGGQQVDLHIIDTYGGFPSEAGVQDRPEGMVKTYFGDNTNVSKSFRF